MQTLKKNNQFIFFIHLLCLFSIFNFVKTSHALFPDSGQTKCYDNYHEIICPNPNEPFYGQDGNYQGPRPAYQISDDGIIVTDLNTGLMWQQADDEIKRTWTASVSYCEGLAIDGYSDWRLPSRLGASLNC